MSSVTRMLLSVLVVSACSDSDDDPQDAAVADDDVENAEQTVDTSEITEIEIAVDDFMFEARAAGPEDGPGVILLHGFPQTSYAFRHQVAALAEQGYRAVAPDQRGYSPGARPLEVEDYGVELLAQDVIGMADALGFERFHLIGHDWGAVVAWTVGGGHSDRLITLTTLSVPHPDSLVSFSSSDSTPAYITFLVQPGSEDQLLANDAGLLRSIYDGLEPEDVDVYVERLGTSEALGAAINWYRAAQLVQDPVLVGQVGVPTMFIWSDQDEAVSYGGVIDSEGYVDAPYRYEILEGVNHWIPDVVPDVLSGLLVDHLGAYPDGS